MPVAMPSCATFDAHSTPPAPLGWAYGHNFFLQITDAICESNSRKANCENARFIARHRRLDYQHSGKPIRRTPPSELRLPSHQTSLAEPSFRDQP
jgi:hypothetical protein